MDGFAAEQSLRDAGLSSLMVLDTYSPITEVRCSNQSRDVISSGAPSNTVRRGMPCQHRHVSRLVALTVSGRGVTAATAERRGAAASRSPSWRCAEIAILAENRRRNYIGAFIRRDGSAADNGLFQNSRTVRRLTPCVRTRERCARHSSANG